ncbi:MAG TPA: porin [Steroidobacteraceae bacterium]|nr:porin [Steroidobacteraceae bacterium]
MHKFQLRKPLLAAMGACAAIGISPGIVLADNAQDIQQLKDQVRQMQQKIDQLSSGPQSSAASAPSGPTSAPAKKNDSGSLTWNGITLYGTVDIGVEYVSHGAPLSQTWGPGLPSFIQNFSNHSITSVNGNGLSQSKVGISGVEPLFGFGDWTGIFRVETGFNPWDGRLVDGPGSLIADNGKAAAVKTSAGDSSRAGQAFNGVTFAGISSKTYGTLTFGRQNGLMLDMLTKYDPQLQAQAFSPIALSGTSGGLGDTQSNRLDNSIKYQLQVGPARIAYMHGFGSDGYVPQNSNEFTVGADFAGFSIDALYGLVHGEVSAASLSAANITALNATPQPLPGWSLSNTLAATISDNTGYSLQMSYNAKDYFPVKFYAGWERIKYNNPSHPDPVGTVDIGGYVLGVVNNTAYNIQKIFTISWVGARWSVTPDLDLTLAGYGYNQKSFAANGCSNISAASCAGELADISLVGDWHFTKRFDTYAGVNWSRVQNGLANGYLFTSEYSPMVGVRYNF